MEKCEDLFSPKAGDKVSLVRSLVMLGSNRYIKVAVGATDLDLSGEVCDKLEECQYLLVIDPQDYQCKAFGNPFVQTHGPASEKFLAQLLKQEHVYAMLVGVCRSDIINFLKLAGVHIVFGASGSIRRAVENFKRSYCFENDNHMESQYAIHT